MIVAPPVAFGVQDTVTVTPSTPVVTVGAAGTVGWTSTVSVPGVDGPISLVAVTATSYSTPSSPVASQDVAGASADCAAAARQVSDGPSGSPSLVIFTAYEMTADPPLSPGV